MFSENGLRDENKQDFNCENRRLFPFHSTPSGNLKVGPNQVVFESQKVSVLVADPHRTKVNISMDDTKNRFPISQSLTTACESKPELLGPKSVPEMFSYPPHMETLFPRPTVEKPNFTEREYISTLNLESNGYYYANPINWSKIALPKNTELKDLLLYRITNYINSDCQVHIGKETFNCHLLVLQCYSSFFDNKKIQEIELPENKVSGNAFEVIYKWMVVSGTENYRLLKRENILQIFLAAQYLGVRELEDQCWAFMDNEDLFYEDTAFLLYLSARSAGQTKVMELMVPRIMKFFLTLVSSHDFLALGIDEVCVILSSNYISVHCEIEVFMTAVRWLMYNYENRKQYLEQIMRCVRFGLIEPWQLVDIRRNPENPEFIEVTSCPEVHRLVEEGLAFAIIKYWYGDHTQDYFHWINLINLSEPANRNWIPDKKNYVRYEEFLQDLEIYRQIQIAETQNPIQARTFGLSSTWEAREKNGNSVGMNNGDGCLGGELAESPIRVASPPLSPTSTSARSFQNPQENDSSANQKDIYNLKKHGAAKKIQKSWRNYLEKKQLLKQLLLSQSLEGDAINKVKENVSNRQTKFQRKNPETNPLVITYHHCHILKPLMPVLGTSLPAKNKITSNSLFLKGHEAVLVAGGVDPHTPYGVSRNTGQDLYRFEPTQNAWALVGQLPSPRHQHDLCFCKGILYLAGGADPKHDEFSQFPAALATVWSLNPFKNIWGNEPCLVTPRKNLALVALGGQLYAFGGKDAHGRILSSVEKFESGGECWQEVAPMPHARMGHAAAKLQEFIWVAGGLTNSRRHPFAEEVVCYNAKNDQWTTRCVLPAAIGFAKMLSLSGKLFLLGGAGSIGGGGSCSLSDILVWDPSKEDLQWQHIGNLAIARHGHTLGYLGSQLVIIGGVTTVYMKALNSVECFCREREELISNFSHLPVGLFGHASATLPPLHLM